MKKIEPLELQLCKYQAKLFERSIDKVECSSKIFIRRFMKSQLAKRMDNIAFMFGSTDINNAFEELEEEYGPSSYGSVKFSYDQMHWIGYIYRYWSCISGRSSRQLYKIYKPDKLRQLYLPYHSLDPLQAIERINEELDPLYRGAISDIEVGVIALKRVRSRYQSNL